MNRWRQYRVTRLTKSGNFDGLGTISGRFAAKDRPRPSVARTSDAEMKKAGENAGLFR
jgi:hypothetical protein